MKSKKTMKKPAKAATKRKPAAPRKATAHAARKPVSRKVAPLRKPAAKQPAKVKNATAAQSRQPASPNITPKELQEIKKHLNTMKQDIVARIQEKKNMDMPEPEVGDPIDQASQSLDKEILFEVSDNDYKMLDQIEATLRRMEKGLYGCCQSCGKTIPLKRLRALPFARCCVNCQTSNEGSLPE